MSFFTPSLPVHVAMVLCIAPIVASSAEKSDMRPTLSSVIRSPSDSGLARFMLPMEYFMLSIKLSAFSSESAMAFVPL